MSAMAQSGGLKRTAALYESAIGKKAVMAISGLVLCGFLIEHMLGNWLVFAGPEALNKYAAMLKSAGDLLWVARAVLIVAALAHIWSAYQLWALKRAARPIEYVKKEPLVSSYAARTMRWSGPIVLAFLFFHLLHFTTGQVHPNFKEGDVYSNVVIGFSNPLVALFYIVANIMVGFHLYHGAWSMFQSLGAAHPKYTPKLQAGAKAFGLLIGIGNCLMPLAVLAGVVR
jgi:succinate dehydrogenase / fumarate reductase, cytochrome b subunit